MNAPDTARNSAWPLAAAVLTLASAALAVVEALDPAGVWTDVLEAGAGVAGAAVLVLVGVRLLRSPWALVAAAVPVAYLLLATAPKAVSLETMPVVRFTVALGALGAYVGAARPLGRMPQYGLCCAVMGVAAAFFLAWEPPPPKPVPIARPLALLRDDLLAKMPGWEGEHEDLEEAIEAMLGADEYLNLELASPESPYHVRVFVAYNANAMTNIPHVPWVCMTKGGGYRIEAQREETLPHPTKPGSELETNLILFRPGQGMPPVGALMFQYFNIGGTYAVGRGKARILATTGAIGREGSYFSQTQVSVFVPWGAAEGAMDRSSQPYGLCRQVLNALIPLLEQKYYPDLDGSEGGE